MKTLKYTLGLLALLVTPFTIAADDNLFYVTADNGLIIRDAPNGKRIGKLPYGYPVRLVEQATPISIKDELTAQQGHWQRIDFNAIDIADDLEKGIDSNSAYIADIYLQPKADFEAEKQQLLSQYASQLKLKLATDYKVFALKGDFFGDGVLDDVLRAQDQDENILLVFINHQANALPSLSYLGGGADVFNIDSYPFAILTRVPQGQPLWSNYENDFRNFADVPEAEIQRLTYDALYVHEAESCGGGFIFWQNNQWNWLQQE